MRSALIALSLIKKGCSIACAFQASKAKEVAHLERIQRGEDEARKGTLFRPRLVPKSISLANAPPITESPVLLGLEILSYQAPPSTDNSVSENIEPQITTPQNQRSKTTAYELHSTIRAKKRASFDERRALREMERQEEQEKLRQSMIKQRRAELTRLGKSLR